MDVPLSLSLSSPSSLEGPTTHLHELSARRESREREGVLFVVLEREEENDEGEEQ